MNRKELKFKIFRECVQDMRDIQRRLRLLGEIMIVNVWWKPEDTRPVEFSSQGVDLRKRIAYNRLNAGPYMADIMGLFSE